MFYPKSWQKIRGLVLGGSRSRCTFQRIFGVYDGYPYFQTLHAGSEEGRAVQLLVLLTNVTAQQASRKPETMLYRIPAVTQAGQEVSKKAWAYRLDISEVHVFR